MKKGLLLGATLLCIVLSLSLLFAVDDAALGATTNTSASDSSAKVELAYSCLTDKVKDRCSLLSFDEKMFALMSLGKCQDELLADSVSQECWPETGCSIKATAQAILALDLTTYNTAEAEDWLLTQTAAPEDIDWYLQIDSAEATTCKITYDGVAQTTTINADKQFTKSAGNCLSLASGDYWLRISPTCYEKEFQISCDKGFQTSLLYKKKTSSTFYVSESIQSPSADGTATEMVSSACFVQGGKCTYEGSLWATLVLYNNHQSIKKYLPYLTTLSDENQKYLPDAFLYLMTGNTEYKNNLLLRQRDNQYWDEANNNRYYDTAIALFGLKGEVTDSEQKANAKKWLLEVQDTGETPGCWKGSVANTGFILSAVWPKQISTSTGSCSGAGYNCVSEVTCTGNILPNYFCSLPLKCCDKLPEIKSCAEQVGEICISSERCSGTITQATLLGIGETCCVGGTCAEDVPQALSDCEENLGTCEPFGCAEGEEEAFYQCDYGDTCCTAKESSGGSLFWIILLIILIVLAILGIIFRKKLGPFFENLKSKFRKKGAPGAGVGMPRGQPMYRAPLQRRVLPPNAAVSRPAPVRAPPARPKAMDDVLGRLKEMSK